MDQMCLVVEITKRRPLVICLLQEKQHLLTLWGKEDPPGQEMGAFSPVCWKKESIWVKGNHGRDETTLRCRDQGLCSYTCYFCTFACLCFPLESMHFLNYLSLNSLAVLTRDFHSSTCRHLSSVRSSSLSSLSLQLELCAPQTILSLIRESCSSPKLQVCDIFVDRFIWALISCKKNYIFWQCH